MQQRVNFAATSTAIAFPVETEVNAQVVSTGISLITCMNAKDAYLTVKHAIT